MFMSRKFGEKIEPGRIEVLFVVGNDQENVESHIIDGVNFGGADAAPFIDYCRTVEEEEQAAIMQGAIDLLDRESNWEVVKRLAGDLCSQPGTGADERRKMDRENILPLFVGVSSQSP